MTEQTIEQEDKLGPLQRKWVEALKSGEYKQGGNRLRTITVEGDAFCCLGVADKVLGLKETNTLYLVSSFQDLKLRSYSSEFSSPITVNGENFESLACMNDGKIPFAKIAEVIENNPELVFTGKI